jgi:hypothetical protein
LHGDRREAKYAGQPNDPEFQQAVIDIGHDIEYGLTGEALGDFGITPGASCGLKNTPPDPITLTTRMFAWMAVVYLHLVTHGFKDLQRLETPITSSLELLRTQIPTQIIPALVAPLFIIGCAARVPTFSGAFVQASCAHLGRNGTGMATKTGGEWAYLERRAWPT